MKEQFSLQTRRIIVIIQSTIIPSLFFTGKIKESKP